MVLSAYKKERTLVNNLSRIANNFIFGLYFYLD